MIHRIGRKRLSPFVLCLLVIPCLIAMVSCTAVSTAIKKRSLTVQTQMSDTIFLHPVPSSEQTVFVSLRNTSDRDIHVAAQLRQRLASQGFAVLQDPERANFLLQANILYVDKSDLRESSSALDAGFGGGLGGAGIAAAAGADGRTAVGGALLGAAVSIVGDALVEDTYYTMITDVQIKQRAKPGQTVTQVLKTDVDQGHSSTLNQTVKAAPTTSVDWIVYQTRIVSTANRVNLDFEDALPELQEGLVRSLSQIL